MPLIAKFWVEMLLREFKTWVDNYLVPAYQDLHADWNSTDHMFLVLDNAPYHCCGVHNPFCCTKDENTEMLRTLGIKNFQMKRNGILETFTSPFTGKFRDAPVGPSSAKVAAATYQALLEKDGDKLKTWLERRFEDLVRTK